LYLVKDGRAQALKSSLLHKEVIYSITGRENEIWIGTQHSGLQRLEYRNGVIDVKRTRKQMASPKTACLLCIKAMMEQCGPQP